MVRQLTVAKCEESELANVRDYLQELKQVIDDYGHIDEDDWEANKSIADVARKYPSRAFIVPLNLGILLDNYQDEESDIIQHPKWIMEMIDLLEEMDKHLSESCTNSIVSGSILHEKIKSLIKDNDEN